MTGLNPFRIAAELHGLYYKAFRCVQYCCLLVGTNLSNSKYFVRKTALQSRTDEDHDIGGRVGATLQNTLFWVRYEATGPPYGHATNLEE